MYRSHVLVCGGTGCTSSHSGELIDALNVNIKEKGLEEEIQVVRTGCFGLCALGPIMIVYPEGCFYSEVKVEDIPEIVEEHLLKGRIVKRLLYSETVTEDAVKPLNETNFYSQLFLCQGARSGASGRCCRLCDLPLYHGSAVAGGTQVSG